VEDLVFSSFSVLRIGVREGEKREKDRERERGRKRKPGFGVERTCRNGMSSELPEGFLERAPCSRRM